MGDGKVLEKVNQTTPKVEIVTEPGVQKVRPVVDEVETTTGEKCVHQLFEGQAEQNPDALAVTFEGEQIRFQELNSRSNQVAHGLLRLGLQVSQPVAVLIDEGPAQIEVLFGTLKAGCLFVCLDAKYPTERLSTILDEVAPPLLIADRACLNRHPGLIRKYQEYGQVLLTDSGENVADQTKMNERCVEWDVVATCSTRNPDIETSPAQPAYIVYTSGSTGQPKGIVQSHRSFSQFIEWQSKQFDIVAPERWAQWASIGYDASYCEIFGALCFGATLCMTKASVRYDPTALINWARTEKITILQIVPSFCRQVVETLRSKGGDDARVLLPDLRLLMLAGETLPVDLAKTWLNLFADPPKLFNLYGPSESVLATYYAVERTEPDQLSIPIGRPIDGREILILDDEQKPCPKELRGEIYIRSKYLTSGYFKRQEETDERFIQNPLHNDFSDPVYRTGDLGRLVEDGNIEFCGRADNLVKLRGFRIELGEIESVLLQHPRVKESVVIARDEVAQNGSAARVDKRLVAYIVPGGVKQVKVEELRNFVKSKLPQFMVPSAFVMLDALPVNRNGKVDRTALPAPSRHRSDKETPVQLFPDKLEMQLQALWQELIGVEPIAVDEDFFDVGGHSLMAVDLFDRIDQSLGKRLPFETLLKAPTIRELANVIRSEGYEEAWASLVAIQPAGSKPPLFAIHPGDGTVMCFRGLAKALGPDQPVYGLRARGIDGKQKPRGRVASMAEHYLREIRALQPEGPYFLAGRCFGGIVAFEMAQQLHSQEQEVGMLAILDTNMPNVKLDEFEVMMALNTKGRNKRVSQEMHGGSFRNEAKIKDPIFQRLERIGLRHRSARKHYRPQPYPGQITLFRDGDETPIPDYQVVWAKLAQGGVDVHLVPGNHFTIMREPNVRVLAKKLRAAMDAGILQGKNRPTVVPESAPTSVTAGSEPTPKVVRPLQAQ